MVRLKQRVEKEDVYSSLTIFFHSLQSYSLSLSFYHLIFFPPYSHLFIFSIYHPLPRSLPFLSFFFYHSSSPRESQRKKKIFFPSNQTIRFLDSGKKKKNFASNIPPIISRNILAIISPPIFFHERKRNEVE